MVQTTIKLIEEQVTRTPDKTAVLFQDKHVTYAQMNELANQMATYLIKKGAVKESIIGIAIDRSIEMVIAMLAVFKSGAAYVPLDPDYPNKRLEYMLGDSNAQFLITNAKYKSELTTKAEVIVLEDMYLEMSTQIREELPLVRENDLAYILYTSGSTGQPKGVMIEHQNLFNLLQSIAQFPGLDESDRLLSLTTISFDISVLEIFLPLTVGATLVVAHTDVGKDGEAILNIIKEHNITFMQATPSTYKMMLAAEWEEKCDMKVTCCGEQLPKDLADKILQKCSRLFNMYGPTETTIYSTGKEILTTDALIAIGKPIKDTEVYILNEQHQLVANGEIGEICIGGEGVARGYFGKPDLTEQKFIPFRTEDGITHRLYKTGDLGKFLENGEIQCLGRIDHQIKIRGYRIETGEIEYFLKQQPDITEALVTAWTGPTGDKRIAAYITSDLEIPEADAPAYYNKWKQMLRSAVPYYMVPSDFMLIHAFPLTENGKVDRKALPSPVITNNFSSSDDSLPRNPTETLIANIWAEHLGMDSVGIYDNFFDLGGHSLTAVKVIVQIKKESGKYLPLASLFKNPTIAELSTLLSDEKQSSGFESLVPLKTGGDKIPLYIVHGLGSTAFKFYDFAHQLDKDQPVYGLQARGIDGTEEPAETVEQMASQYIEEITKHNPDGPYALSGYSMGGIVAFEMTRQLESAGKKVSVLAMYDSFIIANDQLQPGLFKNVHWVFSRIAKFMYTFYLLGSEPKRTIDHKVSTLRRSLDKFMGKEVGNEMGLDENFDIIAKVVGAHQKAIVNYKLKPLDKEIFLFRAKKVTRYLNDFEYLGWRPYAKKVNVFRIDGEHDTIFNDPINKKLAVGLQRVLDKGAAELRNKS